MSGPEVRTSSGPVVGELAATGPTAAPVLAFRGIPYAAAPLGRRRFGPPTPATPWTAARDARRPGPAAPQTSSMLAPILGEELLAQDEAECLTLNVFTPDLAGRRPVLLWLHGGAFVTGYAVGPRQSGAELAACGDVVVVTANYRLGALGYLYLGPDSGNAGLLDQIAALRWVHRNAAAFGGDPDLITVAGHSSGALSAAAVAVSPLAAGLVRRVALASPQLGSVTTPQRAAQQSAAYLDRLGVTAEELHTLPVEDLLKASAELAAEQGAAGVPPSLVVGGAGLPSDISEALAGSDLDLLLGTTRDEARAFLFCDPAARGLDRPTVLGLLNQFLPGRAEDAYRHYLDRRPGAEPGEVGADALTDALFRLPVLRLAQARSAYVYQFDWQPGPGFGACHTADLPFVLGNPGVWAGAPLLAGVDVGSLQPLADAYSGALLEFVRTGRAPWDRYEPGRRCTMRFDWTSGPVEDLAGPERELWGLS